MIQKRNIKAIGDLPQNPFATFTNQFTSILNQSILEKVINKACFQGKNAKHYRYPIDTGRKLNVHKTFRRRPRRLLNVLCTFNLRPVFTGYFELLIISKLECFQIFDYMSFWCFYC